MDSDVSGLAETDENILTLDVPDDALERAAGGTEGEDHDLRLLHLCLVYLQRE
jgi:hypothetical protein